MAGMKSSRRQTASFRRLTGVSVATFDAMMEKLSDPWNKLQTQKTKSGRPWDTGGLEDHLLIMLIYYRCYVTQEFIGFFYHVDKSAICRAIKRLELIARPLFGVKREPRISRSEAEAIIIDCTEQPIQRPGDDEVQKKHYSGKKKRHTVKNIVITDKRTKKIKGLGQTQAGKKHDKTATDEEDYRFPPGSKLWKDTGFQGYEPEQTATYQPKKKPRKGELTAAEKEQNRAIAQQRIGVEHSIGGVKVFRIVRDVYRNHRQDFEDLIMETTCGLHNLRVHVRLAAA